eukprot:554670_1
MAYTTFYFCTLIHISYSISYYCHSAFDTALNCTTPTTTSDNLYARGYKSLFQASLAISITNNRYCSGAYACAETQEMNSFYTICEGAFSCAKTASISATYYVQGYGAHSLTNTHITFGTFLTCYGDQACSHSTITSSNNSVIIYAYGSLSLFNAIINYNITDGKIDLHIKGYYAAYEAIINCNNGATCNIICWYNACVGLVLNCETNACPISYNGFNSAAYPPNTTFILDTNQFYNSTHIINSNEKACNSQQTNYNKTFDNFDEINSGNIVYNTNDGPICCRGLYSCKLAKLLYNSVHAIMPSIVCSGSYSCAEMEVMLTLDSNKTILIVECSGFQSCNKISILSGTVEYLYCYGSAACKEAHIRGIENIYCIGYQGCQMANISSFGRDLTLILTGDSAGERATIRCNTGDNCYILCKGLDSCKEMELICDGTCFLECNLDTQCPVSWSGTPTTNPTSNPTQLPTFYPTKYPTIMPTFYPSISTNYPSFLPTIVPSINPTENVVIIVTFVEIYEIIVEFDKNADGNEIKAVVLNALQTTYPTAVVVDLNIKNNEITAILSISSDYELSTDEINEKIAGKLEDENDIKNIRVKSLNNDMDTEAKNESFFESTWWIFILIGMIIVVIFVIFIYCCYSRNKMKMQLNTTNLNTNTANGEFEEVKNGNNNTNIVKENEDIDKSDEDMYDTQQPTKGTEHSLENEEIYETQQPTKGVENSLENEEMYDTQQPTFGASETQTETV